MPVFKLEIFKRLGTEEWVNRYWMFSTTLAAAIPESNPFVTAERSFHSDQVTFTYRRISDIGGPGGEFINEPLNQSGLVPGSTTAGLLPLWNVVKLYFNKGYNRPDYKLYRAVLGEANTEAGTVASATRTAIEDAFDGLLALPTPRMVTLGGIAIASVSCDTLVRERQLHRRRRRFASPPLVTPS